MDIREVCPADVLPCMRCLRAAIKETAKGDVMPLDVQCTFSQVLSFKCERCCHGNQTSCLLAASTMTGNMVDLMIILWAAHKAVSALHPDNTEGNNHLALSKKHYYLITKWANNCMVTFEAIERNHCSNMGLIDKGDKKVSSAQWLVYANLSVIAKHKFITKFEKYIQGQFNSNYEAMVWFMNQYMDDLGLVSHGAF
ncbi:hypothetical protein VTH82DRAFT_4972 [Thermothelomyces myriococcoides]